MHLFPLRENLWFTYTNKVYVYVDCGPSVNSSNLTFKKLELPGNFFQEGTVSPIREPQDCTFTVVVNSQIKLIY